MTVETYYVELAEDTTFSCPLCKARFRHPGHTVSFPVHGKDENKPCPASKALVLTDPLSGEALVAHAKAIATRVHAKDVDKSKVPYVEHLAGVEAGVLVLAGPNPEAQAAAWLHDAVEDHPTEVSVEKLYRWGFPAAVITAVVAVTKLGQEAQEDYMGRVVAAGTIAQYVKLADLMHNTRPDRLAALPDLQRVRLLKKYTPFKATLMLELGIIQTPEGQTLATKPVGTASTYTTTGSKTHASTFAGTALMKGDWPAGWPSKVKEKVKGHDTRYLLEDGSVKSTVKGKLYRVWLTGAKKAGSPDGWTPADEPEELLEAAGSSKPATGKKKSTGYAWQDGVHQPKVIPGEVLEDVTNVRSLVPPSNSTVVEPVTAKGAPRSVCGKCGRETYKVSSTFWRHLFDDVPVGEIHTAIKPTEDRVKVLVAAGLVERV